jgi:hypothetical protein
MVSFCCNRFKSEWDFVNELLISFRSKFKSWRLGNDYNLYNSWLGNAFRKLSKYSGSIPDAFKHGSEEIVLYVTIIF